MSQTAILGEPIVWTPSSSSDVLECFTFDLVHNGGYQIDTNGFNLEDSTVTAILENGAEKEITLPAGTGESVLTAKGFGVEKFTITGIVSGEYTVTISKRNKV